MKSLKPVSLRLPEDIASRLQNLVQLTGRSKSYYMLEAIKEHLDDLEDIYLAETALARLRKGEDKIISSEEFWDGLED